VAPAITRRAFAPERDGQPIIAGISYGPFRVGQRPGGPNPSAEQIKEDLEILAPTWGMVRVYSSREPTETILRVIQDHDIPIQVMVGAWIAAPEQEGAAEANAAEVAEAIRLANAYPEQVLAVSVGNESQVFWSGHRSDRDQLIGHIQAVRAAVEQPVTTADDYNFWNKPESQAVADNVDFLLLHAYAMWNQQQLGDAVPWTARTIADIQALHPDLEIVMGETGWATALNPEGSENEHIKAPAGEAEQLRFYTEFRDWAAEAGRPYFYFEAFDEPWKGSDDPREVEKHWGLYNVDRTPKAARQGAQP
jgi:exo-beta-1,3-glucanase (GH17 family)